MPETNFVIYQTAQGYTAVTNQTRAQILEALEGEDLELPDLVELTDRAKSTLSSVHMKELLERGLIEEREHPTDKRKKRFHLVARRIGSSELPLEELRSAIKEYVTTSPMAARLPLVVSLRAIAAAPPGTEPTILHGQGRRLGTLVQHLFSTSTPRGFLVDLSSLLEREGLARTLRIDLEASRLDLELGEALQGEEPPEQAATALAGFLEGVAAAALEAVDGGVTVAPLGEPTRFAFTIPEAAG